MASSDPAGPSANPARTNPARASLIGRRAIETEIDGLRQLAAALGDDFDQAVTLIAQSPGRLIVSGVGKSGHVARKIAATFASTGTPALHLHAAEAGHGDLGVIGPGDVLLIVSKSGQSQELTPLLTFALRRDVPIIAVTADPSSDLGQSAQCCLSLPPVAEVDRDIPAPTTSTLMMQALGDALAAALWQQHGFDAQAFSQLHPSGSLGTQLRRVSALIDSLPVAEIVPLEADLATCAKAISAGGVGCVLVSRPEDTDAGAGAGPGQGPGARRQPTGAASIAGIITDGDLRRALLLASPPTAQAIMSPTPLLVDPEQSAAAALAMLEQSQVSQLIVNSDPPRVLHVQTLLRSQVA